MNDRGQYGDRQDRQNAGPVVFVLGITAAIYALSPGALHWYKHGRLPSRR